MLKLLFKALIIAFILLSLSWYANYLMTGNIPQIQVPKPDLPEIKTLSEDALTTINEKISDSIDVIKKDETSTNNANNIYKWRGEDGIIYYTNEAPPSEINYESIPYHKETNVVPNVSETKKTTQSPPITMPGNVYSPEGIKQLLNQAKDIRNYTTGQSPSQQ